MKEGHMIGNMRVAFAAVLAIFVFAIDGSGPAQADAGCRANNYSCPAGYNCVFLAPARDRPPGADQFDLFRCEPNPPAAICPDGYNLVDQGNDGSYRCRPRLRVMCPREYDLVDRENDGSYRCRLRMAMGNPSCAGVPQVGFKRGGPLPPRLGRGGSYTCALGG